MWVQLEKKFLDTLGARTADGATGADAAANAEGTVPPAVTGA